MKNSRTLLDEVVAKIEVRESRGEIQSIACLLLGHLLDVSKTEILSGKPVQWTVELQTRIHRLIERINEGEPAQYVVGEEFFFGRRFEVTPAVLIPRPETEELVREILFHVRSIRRNKTHGLRLLDIGTGSGCIAITLYHEVQRSEVYATDISRDALQIAAANAKSLRAEIQLHRHDIIAEELGWNDLDVIASNPPYISMKEKPAMNKNVLDHEPQIALFVSDEDPLVFYRAIIEKARTALKPDGLLAVEINERFGREISALFSEKGFKEVTIIRDVNDKDRIVRGFFSPS
jgi:release factor glutamine methyltransferase